MFALKPTRLWAEEPVMLWVNGSILRSNLFDTQKHRVVVVTVHGRDCNAYKHYQMLKTAEPHRIIKISIHYFIMTDSFHAHLPSKWKVITYTNPCTVIVIHGHKSSVKK